MTRSLPKRPSEWPSLSCEGFTCDIYARFFLSLNFLCCGNNCTAIERSIEAMFTNIAQGNKSLGRVGQTVIMTCISQDEILSEREDKRVRPLSQNKLLEKSQDGNMALILTTPEAKYPYPTQTGGFYSDIRTYQMMIQQSPPVESGLTIP